MDITSTELDAVGTKLAALKSDRAAILTEAHTRQEAVAVAASPRWTVPHLANVRNLRRDFWLLILSELNGSPDELQDVVQHYRQGQRLSAAEFTARWDPRFAASGELPPAA